jgi:hypothetical protein
MDFNKIKQNAVDYARQFKNNTDFVFKEDNTISFIEWYITYSLAYIYNCFFTGIYTKEKVAKEQKNIFNFVKENRELLEDN